MAAVDTEPTSVSTGETEPTSGSTGETEPTSGSTGETEPTSESAGETEPTRESAGETEPTSENTSESESESESSSETEQAPAYLRFDFGDGLAAAGSEMKYTSNAESLAAVADDCVLGWDATNPMEFDVKVPNGTYEVTYYIFNGSGGVYNQVKAEDVSFSDVRR